jgi:peptidoglycan/xylan/chitin deacetylase (PgdA/CDA1 family)
MRTVITIDIDWVPDKVLEYTLELLSKAGVPCTIFATHATGLLNGLDRNQFEIGIHPNFNPLLNGTKKNNGNPEDVVRRLKEAFPQARGIRSHSSLVSNVLVELFSEMGFDYESNVCLPYSRRLEALPLWNDMLRIPFNWEDYLHFSYGKDFSEAGLDFNNGLNIMTFHPIHIFLNTETLERYLGAKRFYQDPEHLAGYRNPGKGTETLLQKILDRKLEFTKMEDLVDEYRKGKITYE